MLKVTKTKKEKRAVWKPSYGKPYWLINSKGVIENEPKLFSEETDVNDFGIYLSNEQILIPVKYFDE